MFSTSQGSILGTHTKKSLCQRAFFICPYEKESSSHFTPWPPVPSSAMKRLTGSLSIHRGAAHCVGTAHNHQSSLGYLLKMLALWAPIPGLLSQKCYPQRQEACSSVASSADCHACLRTIALRTCNRPQTLYCSCQHHRRTSLLKVVILHLHKDSTGARH